MLVDCLLVFSSWYFQWRASLVAYQKNMFASTEDVSLIPELGKSPGEGNSNPPQYSCLGNLLDRGAWQATVNGVTKELDTT